MRERAPRISTFEYRQYARRAGRITLCESEIGPGWIVLDRRTRDLKGFRTKWFKEFDAAAEYARKLAG